MSSQLQPIQWSDEEYLSFGMIAQVNRHTYHESPLFETSALITLLDDYPRKWLQAFTMGLDPCVNQDWKCVDISPQSTGAELWQAVQNGRIWLNITHVEEYSKDFADLVTGMYEHFGERCPHLQHPKSSYSTLLISSPGAQVYYHLDAEPNMLWHLRGEKRIWVYPDMDVRFAPQNYLEDIYAGEIDENLPYDPSFDDSAESYRLSPGDVASWPHNGPHRIVNTDMNVSLATSYYTPTIYQRQYVQLANRFLLRRMGISNRSMEEQGAVPSLKRFSYRAINKIRPFKRRDRSASYVTNLQIDPNAPLGLRELDSPRVASYSKHSTQ